MNNADMKQVLIIGSGIGGLSSGITLLPGRDQRQGRLPCLIDFANAPDVPEPVSPEEWRGAVRLAHKCLGLKDSRLARRVATIIVDLKNGKGQPSAGADALPRTAQP